MVTSLLPSSAVARSTSKDLNGGEGRPGLKLPELSQLAEGLLVALKRSQPIRIYALNHFVDRLQGESLAGNIHTSAMLRNSPGVHPVSRNCPRHRIARRTLRAGSEAEAVAGVRREEPHKAHHSHFRSCGAYGALASSQSSGLHRKAEVRHPKVCIQGNGISSMRVRLVRPWPCSNLQDQ
jgi:hypothetical protein